MSIGSPGDSVMVINMPDIKWESTVRPGMTGVVVSGVFATWPGYWDHAVLVRFTHATQQVAVSLLEKLSSPPQEDELKFWLNRVEELRDARRARV